MGSSELFLSQRHLSKEDFATDVLYKRKYGIPDRQRGGFEHKGNDLRLHGAISLQESTEISLVLEKPPRLGDHLRNILLVVNAELHETQLWGGVWRGLRPPGLPSLA